jgi:NSS family neurotransmitter:Na+ symporter
VTPHETWSSRLGFFMAAVGAAVGLGNIWKFPYMTGANGGGAFVLVYLACVAGIAVPILTAELLIGRRGGGSPIATMRAVARAEGASPAWVAVGWLGVAAGYLILTYYSVIAGWALAYVARAASGAFAGQTGTEAARAFEGLLADPIRLAAWHALFMALTVAVVARGLHAGIERAVVVLMPALGAMMLLLVGWAAVAGDLAAGWHFLFDADFSRLDPAAVLTAAGQAFFSVGVAMAIMMTYGAYLPPRVSIPQAAFAIAAADTLVALLAGLAIFPLVFAHGLDPAEGPGLTFVTLPLAFGRMPGGGVFATLFFLLLVFAALTSSIAFLEPAVRWAEEHRGVRRGVSAVAGGVLAWTLGLATVLSFNRWADVHPLGGIARFEDKTIFELLDFLTTNVLVTLGGFLIAVFAGWRMSKASTLAELGLRDGLAYRGWRFLARVVAPGAIAAIVASSVL